MIHTGRYVEGCISLNSKRNPEATRHSILEASFWEIFRNGFRSASLDSILAETGVTKGALYHHFPSKAELGYAVVEEYIAGWISRECGALADPSLDPIDTLMAIAQRKRARLADKPELVGMGCPLNNLVQEMSPQDEGFRQRLAQILEDWTLAITEALRRGQKHGQVRADIDADEAARFLVAASQGMAGIVKSQGRAEAMDPILGGLRIYLEGLRPASQPISGDHE